MCFRYEILLENVQKCSLVHSTSLIMHVRASRKEFGLPSWHPYMSCHGGYFLKFGIQGSQLTQVWWSSFFQYCLANNYWNDFPKKTIWRPLFFFENGYLGISADNFFKFAFRDLNWQILVDIFLYKLAFRVTSIYCRGVM